MCWACHELVQTVSFNETIRPCGYLSLTPSTKALRDALKILGLNECYHQTTLIQNPQDGAIWLRALQTRGTSNAFGRKEWDALLGHCQAVCDVPAVHFAKELMDVYPEAKVVLTSRDVEKWHWYVYLLLAQKVT